MRTYLIAVLVTCALFGATRGEQPPEPNHDKGPALAGGNVESLWSDLASLDAAKAYRAIWALTKTPEETVDCIAGHLQPAPAPDPRQVERWIEELTSDRFAVRDKANQELGRLAGLVEPALRKTLTANPSLEARQRIEKLLNRLLGPIILPNHLRAVRAVEALEYIGTGEAKALLAKYAAGAPGARLTQDAKETLERLRQAERFVPPANPPRTDLQGDPLPVGAMGRLGTIRFRRESAGLAGLAFLPDGKTLVTAASGEHDVQVWEVPSGRLMRTVRTEPVSIRGYALARDGKHFAVAGFLPRMGNSAAEGEIRVFALPTGNVIRTFPRKSGYVELAFSPDGKVLFTLDGSAGVLRIEDIASGEALETKRFSSPAVMALSSDGAHVAIASGRDPHQVVLWKWQTEAPRPLDMPNLNSPRGKFVTGVSFSHDNKSLIEVESWGNMHFWDVSTGRLVRAKKTFEDDFYGTGNPVCTPDGKTMAVRLRHRHNAAPGKINLLDPSTGGLQGILECTGGMMAVSADSRRLAVGAGRGVRVWDLGSRMELTGDAGHESDVSHIVVSAQGLLVTGGDDHTVRVWDVATWKQRRKLIVGSHLRAIALKPDGNMLAASSLDNAVHFWDTRTGLEIYRLAGHGNIGGVRGTLRFLSDGQSLLSWGDDFYLRLWDTKTGKARLEHAIRPEGITIPEEGNMSDISDNLGTGALTPDGKTFVLDIAGHYHFFDTATGKEKFKVPSESDGFGPLVISPNSKYLLTSIRGDYQAGKHAVSLLDLSSGTTLQRLVLQGYGAGPVAFSVDGRMFATSQRRPQEEILLYESASGNYRGTIRGMRGQVRSLAFFPDGRRLASGLSDSTAVIWDLAAPLDKGP